MLAELIKSGFGVEEDYNCAEKMLYGANKAYDLKITSNDLKMSAAFGGGMGIEMMCGAVTGALMVIGVLFSETVQHQSPMVREMSNKFIGDYHEKMGQLDCKTLKENHRTDESGCYQIILEAAILLDEIYESEVVMKQA